MQFPNENIRNPYVHLIDTVGQLLYMASSDPGENSTILKIDLQTFQVIDKLKVPVVEYVYEFSAEN